jgi:glycosyltransferase involved in cell wall biosynthesis
MNRDIDITFCIPTFNRGTSVLACVMHLLHNSKYNIEIIVSDNNSSDNTIELLSQISDKRLIIRQLFYNTGTYNLLNAAAQSNGKILTWLSDEDNFEFKSLDNILDKFHKNPNLSVLIGSTVFGVGKNNIQFKDKKFLHRRESLFFLLNFLGCGGVFVKTEDLMINSEIFQISPRNCLSFWNYYPVAFLSAMALKGSLETVSEVTCIQERFNPTTLNWNPLVDSSNLKDQKLPHFYPDSIKSKIISKLKFTARDINLSKFDKVFLMQKFIVKGIRELLSIRSIDFITLLNQHYIPRVVEDFKKEIQISGVRYIWRIFLIVIQIYSKVLQFIVTGFKKSKSI